MRINDSMHGFIVTRIRPAGSVTGELIEMEHSRTGARLAWLDNGDENKLFSVSFKTPPSDDTGVFHILEHSVLGGSEKYPVKEPFLYMLKSSMNTFLNAMTFSDKTMFPVSSRNDKDFMNLTSVYLDAVFKPLIYSVPEIFYQEGHHTEWRSHEEAPLYKGVVFNEMKGVESSIYNRIEEELMSMLYPDTCYQYESGGKPAAIPELTYEQFIAAHKRYYHPSNSYFYLDGAVDIEPVLGLIDSYLSEYEKSTDVIDISEQKPVAPSVKSCYYEIAPEEEEAAHTHIALGKVMTSWDEREKCIACIVLGEALAGSNEAPLKRALLDTGMCLDVSFGINDGIAQPFGALKIFNTDMENADALLSTVKTTATELVNNGIGKSALVAAIDRLEFRIKESEEPKGLIRGINCLSSWLYGGDPLMYLDCDSVFDLLRKQVETDYFEKLLEEWLLDKNGSVTLYMLPSHTYGDEQKKIELERVNAELAAMSDKEKEELIELNRKLDEWQATPDTPENIAALPSLPLSEVSELPLEFKTNIEEKNGLTVLRHPARNKGISSVNLYFAAADFTQRELEMMAVMTELISELPTENCSGAELQQRITGTLGNLNINATVFGREGNPEECSPFLTVKASFLDHNTEKALKLIGELLTETVYDSPEQIREILLQCDEDMKQDIIANGHRIAMRRVRSGMSAESAMNELLCGYEAYKSLHSISKPSDEELTGLISEFKAIATKLFCKSRLTVGTVSTEEISLDVLSSMLSDGNAPSNKAMAFRLETPDKQGIIIPSGVSYSGTALPTFETDKALWGVLSTMLSYEYLWNEVRVKGGAYGTGFGVNNMGEAAFYSYRDPSPSGALTAYSDAAEFIRSYCDMKPDISSYIISSIAQKEPLMSDSTYGSTADEIYFRGITEESRRDTRRRMLSLKSDDLMAATESLSKLGRRCIVGPAEAIKACGEDYEISSI
ncbi:MAG: insulinase family protein [Ruminococcus sp.]|nr:insulinase family protein [Ruminococcus sp.]